MLESRRCIAVGNINNTLNLLRSQFLPAFQTRLGMTTAHMKCIRQTSDTWTQMLCCRQ
jgi:hypothetical protein